MKFIAKKPLCIIALMHEDLVPPDSTDGLTDKEIQPWKMEYDVCVTLEGMGHTVHKIGLRSDLVVIREALDTIKPDIVFNMLEEFDGQFLFDQNVVSYLELKKVPYTGCNPRGLTLAHDKALCKKILSYHRIPVPEFAVFQYGRKVKRPKRLKFPLLVKSLDAEGSIGISHASICNDDESLAERAQFIHRQSDGPAIAEQYIKGREIYSSVVGNERLQTFVPWELVIENLPEGAPNIATSKLKWDYEYQKKVGLKNQPTNLSPELERKLSRLAKRIYRALYLSGYARLDFRMTEEGEFYLLEANPNPSLSYGEDFPEAVEHSGVPYDELLQLIINHGLHYHRNR